jgi:hypothetical protein
MDLSCFSSKAGYHAISCLSLRAGLALPCGLNNINGRVSRERLGRFGWMWAAGPSSGEYGG